MTTWFTKRRHDPGPRGQRCGTGRDLSQDCVFVSPQIGTTNFFWSFPSEAGVKLQQELGRLQARGEELRAQAERARESIRAEVRAGQCGGP